MSHCPLIHTYTYSKACRLKETQSSKEEHLRYINSTLWSCFVERLLLIYGRGKVFLLNLLVLRLVSRNNQILLSGIGRTGTSSVFIQIMRSLTHQLRF